jgi:predicted Zn-dependent protease
MARVTQYAEYDPPTLLAEFVSGCGSRLSVRRCCRNAHKSDGLSAQQSVRISFARCVMMALFVLLLCVDFLGAQNTKGEDPTTISAPISSSPTAAIGDPDSSCDASTEHESHFLTNEQRAELNVGKRLALKIAQEETIEYDPFVTGYLNTLEHKLVQASGLSGCFVVRLIVDEEINAYALPGGFIYMTTGLAISAEREGELVGALAHETGHIVARHFFRLERKRQLGRHLMLAGGPGGYMIGRMFGPLYMRKVMRNTEFEADRLSFQYQYASGYDPGEFIRLLQNINQQDRPSGSIVSRLFDAHPSIAARLRRLDTASGSSFATHANYTVGDSDFRAFKERLLSHYGSR